MSQSLFFEKILSEFSDAISPLRDALETPEAFEAFVCEFGWSFENDKKNIDSIQIVFQDISDAFSDLDTAVSNLSNDGQDQVFLIRQILDSIDKIYNGVNKIKTDIHTGDFTLIPFNQPEFWVSFSDDVFQYLVSTYLQNKLPIFSAILYFFGVLSDELKRTAPSSYRTTYVSKRVKWDRIPKFFTQPGDLFCEVYDWGKPSFNHLLFILNLYRVFHVLMIPAIIEKAEDEELDDYYGTASSAREFVYKLDIPLYSGITKDGSDFIAVDLDIFIMPIPPSEDKNADPIGFVIYPETYGKLATALAISDSISISLSGGFDAKLLKAEVRPDGTTITSSTDDIDFNSLLSVNIKPPSPWILVGTKNSTRLELFEAHLNIETKGDLDSVEYSIVAIVDKLSLTIDLAEGDGFITKSLGSKPQTMDLSISVGWSNKRGFFFGGSVGLEISIPIHLSILGVVDIEAINIELKSIQNDNDQAPQNGATLQTTFNARLKLGPIVIVVDHIGLEAHVIIVDRNNLPAKGINLGDFNLNFGFKPPSGVGLTIDAGGIKGGGFLKFDSDKEEYFGAIELEFKDLFSLKAFGIINTRMPDGRKNFSLLIVITAEFSPIQLGFGFTLNGVGGLLGVNRTTKVEVLKEGIKTNTLKSILFPENVVANINQIVSDIKQVFPPQTDHFLICPMGKIGWGSPTIITIELGILIEIPASGFKILGVLKALLPEEENPLLKLQVNFLGIIDFENKFISFDAILYDSKILTFTLTGDMALRLGFGDKPMFVLSVGGFHPAFKEVPDDLRNMRRITISLYDGDNARITIQTYFAITSNTAQFGAKAELFAGNESGFNIYGFVSYDVLFQFNPFQFIADLEARVALRRRSSVIMGIHVAGELSGPAPWHVHGKASVSFFFFSISVPFHATWGESSNDAGKQKVDILTLLKNAIDDDRNWKADIPANNKIHVSIRTIRDSSMAVHPFGILTFSERLVPLEIEIEKFGNNLPKDVSNFKIKVDGDKLETEEAREQFAPANFFEMTDAQKLDRPSFEPKKSGFKITGSAQLKAPPHIAKKNVDYEFSYLGKKKKIKPDKYKYPGIFFKANTKSAAASQSSLSHQNNRASMNAPEKVSIKEEQYVLANISDMKLHSSELVAASYTEALQSYNKLIIEKPELKDKVQVLSEFELNLN